MLKRKAPIHGRISFRQRNWERITFWTIILLGAGLRLWRIDQNGYGTEYYSAAVRSMMSNWHNFLYNSFDLVRRRFGSSAGLLAALFLALTPVSVAIDRTNNTDSCLILILLLAAWMLMRAAEEGRRSFLLLSLALIGIGFNVKMLAAFVVLPTFVLVYFLGAPLGLKRRIMDLTLGGFVLVLVSLSWSLFYDLTPPLNRPIWPLSFGPDGRSRMESSLAWREGSSIFTIWLL
jgi:4-amino-4-deoxy-L-arabinose transferase-like glycosyltransferase